MKRQFGPPWIPLLALVAMAMVGSGAKMAGTANPPKLPLHLTKETYEQYVKDVTSSLRTPTAEMMKGFPSDASHNMFAMAAGSFGGLKKQIEELVDSDLPGDIYETGTWRGGTSIFMVTTLRAYEKLKGKTSSPRHYYGFDSFHGFEHMQTGDLSKSLQKHLRDDVFTAPLDSVKSVFGRFGILDERTHFIKGLFEDTLPKFHVKKPIALLRMDGDLYSSTKVVLDWLYPHVQPSAWVIIDDYNWFAHAHTCRKAVEDYRSEHGITAPIVNTYGVPAFKKLGT